MLRALVLVVLLALPVGLASSLIDDALLRAGVWLDARTFVAGSGSGRASVEDTLGRDVAVGTPLAARRASALEALADPLPVGLPYAETVTVGIHGDAGAPGAGIAFELAIDAPRVLRVATLAAAGARGGLVVDVLDASDVDASGEPRRLASHGPDAVDVRVPLDALAAPTVRADRPARVTRLLVRVQPTPGATGRFALTLEALPALDFPVATDAPSPVRSFFGMPRDGGRREHHGIDIFAPRGTPVLAAADGIVVRTGDSARGGLHVWQRAVDDAGAALGALYYAHLDRLDVAAGTRVTRGTALGTVGNTGNARTTPPHLHFGLYRRFSGPEDPLPLTGTRRVTATPLEAASPPPRWQAVRTARANLRAGPGTDREVTGALERGELVRVDAVAGGGAWARVRTGTGTRGWVARSLLGAPEPVPVIAAAVAVPFDAGGIELRAGPEPGSATLARLDGLEDVVRLGRYGAALRVRAGDGLTGWVEESPAP